MMFVSLGGWYLIQKTSAFYKDQAVTSEECRRFLAGCRFIDQQINFVIRLIPGMDQQQDIEGYLLFVIALKEWWELYQRIIHMHDTGASLEECFRIVKECKACDENYQKHIPDSRGMVTLEDLVNALIEDKRVFEKIVPWGMVH